MTQEEKRLLLVDLCARLPYGVICQIKTESGTFQCQLKPLNMSYLFNVGYGMWHDCKPYLRTMSSMTEEERLYFHRNSARIQILIDEEKVIRKPFYGYTTHLFDWLNAHHFDYRGLIEKGLALEAPDGMYNN